MALTDKEEAAMWIAFSAYIMKAEGLTQEQASEKVARHCAVAELALNISETLAGPLSPGNQRIN